MDNKLSNAKKVSLPDVSLPKGGGAMKGMGELFKFNTFTGTGSFSVPVYTSPCRDFEPKISLDYDSAGGSGVFGMGFSISVPNISRKTDKGIPRYESSDTFILSNADNLVPKLWENSQEQDIRVVEEDGVRWTVTAFLPRVEGDFSKIEFWEGKSDSFWKVVQGSNITSIYGQSENARIANPEDSTCVFQWLLEKTFDAKGNKIEYWYKQENSENVSDEIYEQNRCHTANKYLRSIRYGNYPGGSTGEAWAFEVVFDYGEYPVEEEYLKNGGCNPYNPVRSWPARVTPFSSYRSGFEIRTQRLCRNILMFHHLEKELGAGPSLIRAVKLLYDESAALAPLLVSVQVTGLRRKSDGSYHLKQMPPLEFSYSPFTPASGSFEELKLEDGESIPGYISAGQYSFADLYGDGIEGLLYSDSSTTFYMKPKGGGRYGYPELPVEFPIERDLKSGRYTLASLDGSGKLDLVVETPQRSGYYEANSDGTWQQYRDFKYAPLDLSNASSEMVDMNGDGIPDLLVLEDGRLRVYPSLKKDGFGEPETACITGEPGEEFPVSNHGSRNEVLAFADMLGDGLLHRVRITNGMVECWPNMGYGRFGKRIVFGNAPRFGDTLDAARLFLADTDGSGAMDIVYAYADRVEVFVNNGGNSFREPISISLPGICDALCQISFADVRGSGSQCMVFSRIGAEIRHFCYDFTCGMKPYLLTQVDNNMGAATCLGYTSSVKFYLEDQQAGRPWKTRLPFPVQVVEKVESIDRISGSKLVTLYKYHDGYYDCTDREFRGFGHAESWDTESFDLYSAPGLLKDTAFEAGDSSLHADPVYTKRWYHTGAYVEAGVLSKHYREEYYGKDEKAYSMPDSTLDTAIAVNDGETARQAYRALAGKLLREEIYGVDDKPDMLEHPYSVTEANFHVRQVQSKAGNKDAVFFVHTREDIYFNYERNPGDPRVKHTFTLEVDAYGNTNKLCTVNYPRRQGDYGEQAQLKAVAEVNGFINKLEDCRLLGVPCEGKAYETGGLDLKGANYFSFEELEIQVNDALSNTIGGDLAFTPGQGQARLISWNRAYFWDGPQEDCLGLGEITGLGLLHHVEEAEFSRGVLDAAFGSRVTPDMLEQDGGYVLKDGCWWNRGLVQYYYKEGDNRFYLPWKVENPYAPEPSHLHAKTTLEYDAYCITPVKQVMYLNASITNSSGILVDYITLQPKQITDINGNVAQVLFDPLGMVTAASVHGMTGGKPQGDGDLSGYTEVADASFDDILANPYTYLQNASAFFYYDYFAWKERRQPACFIHLVKEMYLSDLTGGDTSPVQVQISYSDGFGRIIESKNMADPGEAILRDARGNISTGFSGERWLVSGRTVYNNKGKPVKQYRQYFSSIPGFEDQKEVDPILPPPTVTHYDPLLRSIRIDTPKGFFTKVEFTPWEERYFDENDTIKDSSFYKWFMESYPENPTQQQKDEKDALEKAALFYDTYGAKALNNMGNVFMEIQHLPDGERLATRYELDIEGKVLAAADPRLGAANSYNFKYIYSISGEALSVESADAGLNRSLTDIFGNPVHSWDSRGFHISRAYDAFQRPMEVHVQGDTLNQTVEKIIYGEYSGSSIANLRGKVYKQYDQAGVATYSRYDIKGQPVQVSRQLKSDYKNEANWDNIDMAVMENEVFTTEYAYDALGRIIFEKSPDGSIHTPKYNQTGLLCKVNVSFNDGSTEEFAKDIQYNANGQRTSISYGNGVTTRYTYEDTTWNVLNILTTRPGGSPLQNIGYTYDPAGNVTRLRDSSHETVFNNQQIVEPASDYTYDALYRLTAATGRQRSGVKADTHRYDFKQCGFTPFSAPGVNDGQKLENYREIYSYDTSGNLTSIRHSASSASWTSQMEIAPGSNRTSRISSTGDVIDYYDTRYDANGNMQNLEHLSKISWNYRNNIARADVILRDGSNSDSEYYVYDSGGNRIRKVTERMISSTTTEREEKIYLGSLEIKRIKRKTNALESTILDRQSLHIMDDKNRIAVVHLWLNDANSREVDAAGVRKFRYQLANLLGSSCMEVDGQGAIISYEEYYPYGGTSIIAGQNQREVSLKEYRYSAKERDDVTGLYYYGARYYASWLGRWMSPDPAGTVDGLNLYAFVKGNPAGHVDIKGMNREKAGSSGSSSQDGLTSATPKSKAANAISDQKISPSMSVKDAENFARKNNLADKVNYTGLDPRVADEWNAAILDTITKFPELRKNLHFIGSTEERNNSIRQSMEAGLKAKFKKADPNKSPAELESIVQKHVERQMLPFAIGKKAMALSSDHAKYGGITVVNRVGGNYDKFSRIKQTDVANSWKPEGTGLIRATVDHELGHQLDDLLGISSDESIKGLFTRMTNDGSIKKQLSGYSAKNIKEFVAEGWSEYVNNPAPRPAAKKIGETILRKYAKFGESKMCA